MVHREEQPDHVQRQLRRSRFDVLIQRDIVILLSQFDLFRADDFREPPQKVFAKS
jgi:hypothetical protein